MDATAGSLDGELLDTLRAAALERALALGSSEASVRVEEIRSQLLSLRDGVLETTVDDTEIGVGVRVVHQGSVGFAATVDLRTDAAAHVAEQAFNTARMVAPARSGAFELVDEPGNGPP